MFYKEDSRRLVVDVAIDRENSLCKEGVDHKLLSYFLEHPGAALSTCVLTFGGLLLLLYCLHIGFLPDISLESAVTLLYAASIIGLFIVLVLVAYLVMPALVPRILWNDYKQQGMLTVNRALLISGGTAFFAWVVWFFYLSFPIWKVFSSAVTLLVIMSAFLLVSFLLAWLLADKKDFRKNVESTSGACVVDGSDENMAMVPSEVGEVEISSSHSEKSVQAALMVVATAFVQWMLLASVIMLTVGLGQESRLQKDDFLAFFVLILLLIFSSIIPLLLQEMPLKKALRSSIFFGSSMLLLMLLLTGSFSKPSTLVISKLGVGEVDVTRLVLSGKGCKQLNQALGAEHCIEVKDDEPTAVCPVTLRSRIGAQVLIEVAPMMVTENGKLAWRKGLNEKNELIPRKRVVLDKSTLLAWSTFLSTEIAAVKYEPVSDSLDPASLVYLNAGKALLAKLRREGNGTQATTFDKFRKNSISNIAAPGVSDVQPYTVDFSNMEEALFSLCGRPRPIDPERKDEIK